MNRPWSTKALLLSVVIVASPVASKELFLPPERLVDEGLEKPQDLNIADFDLDGDLDLVFQSLLDPGLAAFENDSGEFEYRQLDHDPLGLDKLAVSLSTFRGFDSADFDGDGDSDLVSVSDQTVTLLLNDGGWQFSSATLEDSTVFAKAVEVADFNQDGAQDFMVGGFLGIEIYINQGEAQFERRQIADLSGPGDTGAQQYHIADIDADGFPDIGFARNSAPVRWLPYPFRGFGAIKAIPMGFDVATAFQFADFDGDQRADLLYSTRDSVRIRFNSPTNPFAESTLVVSSQLAVAGVPIFVGDLDQDNDVDFAMNWVDEQGDIFLVWYRNNGEGQFQRQLVSALEKGSRMELAAGDFNLDGQLDLVAADIGFDEIRLFNSNGHSFNSEYLSIRPALNDLAIMALADLNQLGQQDLIASSRSTGQITATDIASGTTAVLAQPTISVDPDDDLTLAIGDFDGDDLVDFITTTSSTFNGVVTLNKYQNGEHSTQQITDEIAGITASHAVDIDDDGDLDLLLINRTFGGPLLILLENMGSSQFLRRIIDDEPARGIFGNASRIASGDLNNDSRVDIVIIVAEEIVTYIQTDNGFSRQSLRPDNILFDSLALGDVNNDGDTDIVYGRREFAAEYFTDVTSHLGWLENDGDGQFSDHTIPVEFNPRSIESADSMQCFSLAVGDLDNDGDVDLACAFSGRSSEIHWYEQRDGSFFQQRIDNPLSSPTLLTIADIGQDGHSDIITATTKANRVNIYRAVLSDVVLRDGFEQ